jgi:hypothetical protein
LVIFQIFYIKAIPRAISEGFDTDNTNFCSHVSDAISALGDTPPNSTKALMNIHVALEIQSNNRTIVSYLNSAKMDLQTQKFTDAISQLNHAYNEAGCKKSTSPTASESKSTIYGSTPDWLISKNKSTKYPYIQAAMDALSSSPPKIQEAVTNIQKALDDTTEKYSKDPSAMYIEAIHQLTTALNNLRSSPINIADSIVQLKSAITTLDKIPSGQLQQNCFNQTYVGSVCPQSVIETFSVNMNVFKNANNSFVTCLESTRNTQYGTLLGKLKQIQSLLDQL